MNIKYHIFFLVVLFLLSIPKAESQNNISEVDTAKLKSELRALSIKADTLNANEEYDKYEDCLFQELEICYTLADTVLSAKIMYDLAVSFANTLRSAEALKYLNKSMSICQKTSDSALLGEIYYKLGAIYAETRIYDMALDYTNRYLKIAKSLGNDKGVLSAEVTIAFIKGELYEFKNDTTSLLEALNKCEEIFPKINMEDDLLEFMNFCINVPNMYIKAMEFSDPQRAKYFLQKADEVYCAGLPLTKESQIFYTYMFQTKIALFCAKKKYAEAKRHLDSFKHDSELENYVYVTAACTYYKAIEDYPNILKYTSQLRTIANRSFSPEMCASNERRYSQSNYEEKIAEYEKESKKRDLLFKQESERSEIWNQWMMAVMSIVVVIVIIKVIQLKNSNKVNKTLKKANDDINFRNQKLQELQNQILSQNEKILSQNALIEEQKNNLKKINEHLIGSIRYAQRIQKAAVPSKEMMDEIFQESFVFWQPRDIVSGDFYWAGKDNFRKYIITADCTGHGVPGALLSMLGISVISDAFATITPQSTAGEILDKIKTKFTESWSKSGGNIEDGIDMALFVVDYQANTLQYAGAKRPMVMVRNNESSLVKPDKMCVGYNIKKLEKPFTTTIIEVQKGDMFYAFSDGIPDQFGGEDGKQKFSQKNLLELLENIADLSMEIQQTAIKANVMNWMEFDGKKYNQLDDQLLVGIRI